MVFDLDVADKTRVEECLSFFVFFDLPVSKIAASKREESGSLGCDVC